MALQKLSKLCCKGSPPVITQKDSPFSLAIFMRSIIFSIDTEGCFFSSHEFLVSHHEHPTLHPANLTKKALFQRDTLHLVMNEIVRLRVKNLSFFHSKKISDINLIELACLERLLLNL